MRLAILGLIAIPIALAACIANTTADTGIGATSYLQNLLNNGNAGYTLELCKDQVYNLDQPLVYMAQNQVRGFGARFI